MSVESKILRAGRWLTKRRNILLAPLFAAALLSARSAPSLFWELAWDVSGVCCVAGGIWLRLLAASYHDSSDHAEPITAGPYSWVRHPLYLSNFLLGLGIILATGWWPMVAIYGLVFLPLHWVIARSEEVHLTGLYGAKYETYRRTVPAILPLRRFRGPRYGSRSRYKLKKGKENIKSAAYLAGMLAFLLVKSLRHAVRLQVLPPLPWRVALLAAGVSVAAIALRPNVRSKWLRVFLTILCVVCMLLVIVHVPGVLPAPVVTTVPAVSVSPAAVAPAVSVPVVHTPVPVEPKQVFSPARRSLPRLGFLPRTRTFLWNHLDIVGGAVSFGAAALIEKEQEEHNFKAGEDLGEASQVGLGAAFALGLWRQWRGPAAFDEGLSKKDPWSLRVRPAVERNSVSLVAVFKRRF